MLSFPSFFCFFAEDCNTTLLYMLVAKPPATQRCLLQLITQLCILPLIIQLCLLPPIVLNAADGLGNTIHGFALGNGDVFISGTIVIVPRRKE